MESKEVVYLVALKGKNVFSGYSVECVLTDFSKLAQIRTEIEKEHNIQFDSYCVPFCGVHQYRCKDKNKDITLIITPTSVNTIY